MPRLLAQEASDTPPAVSSSGGSPSPSSPLSAASVRPSSRSSGGKPGSREAVSSTPSWAPKAAVRSIAQSRSADVVARRSTVIVPCSGMAFWIEPDCTTVTFAVMPGRAPSSSASMRSASRASARSAERPCSGAEPAWEPRPRASTVTQVPALRALTTAPLARPHSNVSAASAPRQRCSVAGAPVRPSSSGTTCSSTAGRSPPSRARRSMAARATSRPPFMSATPGPSTRSPSSRSGRAAAVPSGKTVSAWPISSTRPGRVPASVAIRCGPLASCSTSTVQPAAAAQPASSPTHAPTPSASPVGESIAQSAVRRSAKPRASSGTASELGRGERAHHVGASDRADHAIALDAPAGARRPRAPGCARPCGRSRRARS